MRRLSRAAARLHATPVRFQVDVQVHSLHVRGELPEGSQLSVVFQRGPKMTATDDAALTSAGDCSWGGQRLSLIATLYKDKKTGEFQGKPAKLTVRRRTWSRTRGESHRGVGIAELDLAAYAGVEFESVDEEFALTRCADAGARLRVTVSTVWLRELGGDDDTLSTASGFSGVSIDAASFGSDHDDVDLADFGIDENARFGDDVDEAPAAAVDHEPAAAPAPAKRRFSLRRQHRRSSAPALAPVPAVSDAVEAGVDSPPASIRATGGLALDLDQDPATLLAENERLRAELHAARAEMRDLEQALIASKLQFAQVSTDIDIVRQTNRQLSQQLQQYASHASGLEVRLHSGGSSSSGGGRGGGSSGSAGSARSGSAAQSGAAAGAGAAASPAARPSVQAKRKPKNADAGVYV